MTRFTTEFLGRGDMASADTTLDSAMQGVSGQKPQGPIDGREEYKAIIAAFLDAFRPSRRSRSSTNSPPANE